MKTRKNNCDEMLQQFSLYLDDELDEVSHKRVQRHQASCTTCNHLFQELRSVDFFLKQAPLKYAPLGFTENAVTAAFDAEMRRNLLIGFIVLMLGTIVISGLVILGQIEIIGLTLSLLFAPGFLNSSPLWLSEFLQAITVAGRIALGLLNVMRQLLIGPLLIPSFMSLLAALFVLLFVGRTIQRQPVSTQS